MCVYVCCCVCVGFVCVAYVCCYVVCDVRVVCVSVCV